MIINMTFTGKPLKNAITKVKTLIDQLLLYPDVHFANKFVLKALLGALYFGVTAEAETKAVVGQSHLARIPLFTCTKEVGVSHCGAC